MPLRAVARARWSPPSLPPRSGRARTFRFSGSCFPTEVPPTPHWRLSYRAASRNVLGKSSIAGSVGPAAVNPSRVWGRFTTVFFFLFAAIIWIATRGPGAALDLFENGHWLAPASDMLAGKMPYHDTFPMHGFLSDGGRDYLVFRLFGTTFRASVEVRHVLESFFHPAIFLVAAARRPLLAALAVPLNVGMAIATVADRPVLPLLSLAAFAWALGEDKSP